MTVLLKKRLTMKERNESLRRWKAEQGARQFEQSNEDLVWKQMKRVGQALKSGQCYLCGSPIVCQNIETGKYGCAVCGESFYK